MKTFTKFLKYLFGFLLFAMLIATLVAQTDFGNLKKSETDFDFISIAGEEVRFIQKGSGPDILLIHGTPGSIEEWNSIMDELANEFRVTAYDRPGFGFSSANNCEYTIAQNVGYVEALVKKLNLKDPLFIGHSYGGSIMAHYAATRPLPPNSKIMIIDSPLFGHNVDPALKSMTVPVIGKGMSIISRYTIGPSKIESGLRKLLVSLTPKQADDFVNNRMDMWLQPKSMYGTSNERNNYDSNLKAVSAKYNSIPATIPISILTGTSPTATLVNDCTKMKSVVPSANLKKFENTGHFIQFEKRDETISIIRAMMTERLIMN